MTMHVREQGHGEAVLLLHAFPCDGRMWLPQADVLAAAGLRVLVPDLPGFGRSPLLTAPPDLDAVAAALLGWLDAARIDHCVIGGASLGGYVAMALLRARPDLATRLVLCGTKATADSPAARDNRERLARSCLESPAETARILEESVLPGLLGETTRTTRPEVVDEVRDWMQQARPETIAWYQRAMAARPDSRSTLAEASVPALVLSGDEDSLSPEPEQGHMMDALGDVRGIRIAGVGHLVNVEAPERVATEMRDFLG